jgi:hypothetical protein
MRNAIVLVALLFSGAVACGGSVSAEPGDGGTDTGESDAPLPDTSWDTPFPETGGGGCGWGACNAGDSCYDGCNSCWCESSGVWSCTSRWCEETGPLPETGPPPPDTYWDVPPPPPPDTPIACPKSLPPPGSYCPGPLKCSYMNSCGTSDFAYCDYPGSSWNVSIGPCTGSCPSSLPKDGTMCSGAAKCEYWKSCGTYDFAYCEPSIGRWKSTINPCPPPPPPPPVCPTTVPKEGSACSTYYMSCAWNNGCGSLIHGWCEGGSWWLSDTGCAPGCPASKPVSGTACKPPSSTACTYITSTTPGGYCASNCFCAEDARWACLPGECSSGGGGGFEDAGPTPYDASPWVDAGSF